MLLNRVMRGGETWPVPKGAALLLTTGNAGGTELLVDGATPRWAAPGRSAATCRWILIC